MAEEPERLVEVVRALRTAFVRYDEVVGRQLGLGRTDLRALEMLERGPVTVGAIVEELGLSSGSATGLVDRLERQGLVDRHPSPDDRRSVIVGLRADAYERVVGSYAPCADAIREVGKQLASQIEPIITAIQHTTDAVEGARADLDQRSA